MVFLKKVMLDGCSPCRRLCPEVEDRLIALRLFGLDGGCASVVAYASPTAIITAQLWSRIDG
jgi:hypothetical protein